MTTVAFIFARGGSKGLPGKNIRPLRGKPLIAWSIEHALAVKRISRVIVSTDCEEIAAVARDYGAEVPFIRPAELARDDSPEWFAWRHALNYIKESTGVFPQVMVSIPTTAPLRLPIDIENCLDTYERGGADAVITITDAHRSPYFNMVQANADGTVGLAISSTSVAFAHRQSVPEVWDMTTVCYVINPQFVMTHNAIFEGQVRAVHIPRNRSIDIDTVMDFQIAECLLIISDTKND